MQQAEKDNGDDDVKSSAKVSVAPSKDIQAFLDSAKIPIMGSFCGPNMIVPQAPELVPKKQSSKLKKRSLNELLACYEHKRAEHDTLAEHDFIDGGDPLSTCDIKRAIQRMSYDYQKTEANLLKTKEAQEHIS